MRFEHIPPKSLRNWESQKTIQEKIHINHAEKNLSFNDPPPLHRCPAPCGAGHRPRSLVLRASEWFPSPPVKGFNKTIYSILRQIICNRYQHKTNIYNTVTFIFTHAFTIVLSTADWKYRPNRKKPRANVASVLDFSATSAMPTRFRASDSKSLSASIEGWQLPIRADKMQATQSGKTASM